VPPSEIPAYRRVLAVVDGSSAAEAAVHKAAAIARRAGASLHVAGLSTADWAVTDPLDRLDVVSLVTRGPSAAMAAYLSRLSDGIRTQWRCEVGGSLLVHGHPSETPAALIRHVGADLMLSTAHCVGPLSPERVGATVVAVARRAAVPVLVVPRTLVRTASRPRVVVLMDRSVDPGHRALQEGRRFACLWDASVTTAQVAVRLPIPATGTYGRSRPVAADPCEMPEDPEGRATGRVLVVGDGDANVTSWVRRVAAGPERLRGALLVCPTS
jgi:nucleotide-binding universal stress UspA family protein